jgi:hypothetical protein
MGSNERALLIGRFVQDLNHARESFSLCDEKARQIASAFTAISSRISEARPSRGREVSFGSDGQMAHKTLESLLQSIPANDQILMAISDLKQAESTLRELEAKKSAMGV